MKRFFEMYLNGLRRWIVNTLLGNNLILQKSVIDKDKIQLIDMDRRIPYGWWKTEIISKRDTKLNR